LTFLPYGFHAGVSASNKLLLSMARRRYSMARRRYSMARRRYSMARRRYFILLTLCMSIIFTHNDFSMVLRHGNLTFHIIYKLTIRLFKISNKYKWQKFSQKGK